MLFILQVELAGARQTQGPILNGGIDLNSAAVILKDEQKQLTNNKIILNDNWVSPVEILRENEKYTKIDIFQDTKL